MGSFIPDVEISFTYHEPANLFGNVRTNIKPESVEEILDNWLYNQMGKGEDNSEPSKQDRYNIRIGLDLRDDSFGTESDTKNKGLTTGIVMEFSRFLSDLSDLERQAFLNQANLSTHKSRYFS